MAKYKKQNIKDLTSLVRGLVRHELNEHKMEEDYPLSKFKEDMGESLDKYEMGTQSLYNPSQTNPASEVLAGYTSGSMTGSTPGLDARAAIPGLGIGLDNIIGGGINAIGSYMHGENQRQKMMANARNEADMRGSQMSQARRFGAVQGQQTDAVLRNEDVNSLNSSYQRLYEQGTEAVMPEEFMEAEMVGKQTNQEPNQALIEVEKDELIFRKYGSTYKLVADFKGGNTHEEGGEPFVAKEGDIIFPGNMRELILIMLDSNGYVKYKFKEEFEELRDLLPEDTPEGTAEKQAMSDEILGTGMQMQEGDEEPQEFEMGGVVNPAEAAKLQPAQTSVGPPTALKQNLNVQRNEENILNQLSGQAPTNGAITPASRMPIAGEEFADMAGKGPLNPDYKPEGIMADTPEHRALLLKVAEERNLADQKANLFPQQQEAMNKVIENREKKNSLKELFKNSLKEAFGSLKEEFGNGGSNLPINGASANDFLFALGKDIDQQTQQSMKNYQSQYPNGTKYYKPKMYPTGSPGVSATPPNSALDISHFFKGDPAKKAEYDQFIKERGLNKGDTRADYFFNYLNTFKDKRTKESGFEAYKKAFKERHGIEINAATPLEFMKQYYGKTHGGASGGGYGAPDNPYEYKKSKLYADKENGWRGHSFDFFRNPTTGQVEYNNIPYELEQADFTLNAGGPVSVTYQNKLLEKEIPKEVVKNIKELEVQKEILPAVNDNRTINDSRSRWQNNNQGNAISGHFGGGYSISANGDITYIPGGGHNIGNQYVNQNQNDYNQGMYGGADSIGLDAINSYNQGEKSRVENRKIEIAKQNSDEDKRVAAEKEAMVKSYEEKKAAAKEEMINFNKKSYEDAEKKRAETIAAETARAGTLIPGMEEDAKKKLEAGTPTTPLPPTTIEEGKAYKRGAKYKNISKDKSETYIGNSEYNEDSSVRFAPKFKGNIGDNSVVGNMMAVTGQGNNLNANRSYTGNNVSNIKYGHNINIGSGGSAISPEVLNALLSSGQTTKPTKKSSDNNIHITPKPYTPEEKKATTPESKEKPKSSETPGASKFSPTFPEEEIKNSRFSKKLYEDLTPEEKQLDDFINLLNKLYFPQSKSDSGREYVGTPGFPTANRDISIAVYKYPKYYNQTDKDIKEGKSYGPLQEDKSRRLMTKKEIEEEIRRSRIPLNNYKRGSKSVTTSKDKSTEYTGSDTSTASGDKKFAPKFKGDIGDNSLAGNEMAIQGQGNNINRNISTTGDQIHNIRWGHNNNINIGNLGTPDLSGFDGKLDTGKTPKLKRFNQSASALGPMSYQGMVHDSVNLEEKNYRDLSDPLRLAQLNATQAATQAAAQAGGGGGLAGIMAAQGQGLDQRIGIETGEAAALASTQAGNVDIRNQEALQNMQNRFNVNTANLQSAQQLQSANKGIESQNVAFKEAAINRANNMSLQQAALEQRNRELAAQMKLAGLSAATQLGVANRQLASNVVESTLNNSGGGGGGSTPTPPTPPNTTPTPDYMKPGFVPTPLNPNPPAKTGIMSTKPAGYKRGAKYKKIVFNH